MQILLLVVIRLYRATSELLDLIAFTGLPLRTLWGVKHARDTLALSLVAVRTVGTQAQWLRYGGSSSLRTAETTGSVALRTSPPAQYA